MPTLVDSRGNPLTSDSLAAQVAERKAFAAADPLSSIHHDGWANPLTGIGTDADKTKHGRFFPTWRVLDDELTALYNGSGLVAKIVDDPPIHMFREGFGAAAEGVSETDAKKLLDFCEEEYELSSTFVEAYTWARLYGGALIVMGIDDGRMPWEPVDEANIRSVDFVAVVDRRYSYVQSTYTSFDTPNGKYGRPELYLIANAFAGQGWNSPDAKKIKKRTPAELQRSGAFVSLVHESRCIRFDGNRADPQTRMMLAGWDWSVIQRVYDVVRQFSHAFDSAGYLLSDASQLVIKLVGLVKAIGAGQKQSIMDRAMMMEQTRSVVRGIILDAGNADGKGAESAERQATSFAGIPDMLDRFMMRIAADAKRPVSVLFGRSPAGLNATGDADIRNWYDDLSADQKRDAAPRLRRFLRYVGLAKQGPLNGRDVRWQIDFKPLWAPTDSEVADAKVKNATADATYVDAGIIAPEEVALGLKEIYPHADMESRESAIKAGKSFDPHENDPDPPPGVDPVTGKPLKPPANSAPAKPPGAAKKPPPGAKADAWNPDQPRDERGRWSEEDAVAASREATEGSSVAVMFGGADDHASASAAHTTAAAAAHELAGKHEALGNQAAAAKFRELGAHHEANAASHAAEAAKLAPPPKPAKEGKAGPAKAASEPKEKAAPKNEKRQAAGRRGAESRQQNEERAKANIPAHLHPLWEQTKGQYKGDPHARAEKFMEHAEANPREAVGAMQASSDARLEALIKEYESRAA